MVDTGFITGLRWCLSDVPPGKLPPTFPHCPLWKGATGAAHVRSREFCSTSFEGRVSTYLSYQGFFSTEDLFLLSHLVICSNVYLLWYGFMDTYFILRVITQCSFICLVTHLALSLPAGNSFSWLLFPLTYSSMVDVCFGLAFEHVPTFWHYKIFQVPLAYFLSLSYNQSFSRGSWFVLLEAALTRQATGTESAVAPRPLSWLSKDRYVGAPTFVYT